LNFRIAQAPELMIFGFYCADIPEEDCENMIRHVQAGGCQNLQSFQHACAGLQTHNKMPILAIALLTFCPNITEIECFENNRNSDLMKICKAATANRFGRYFKFYDPYK